MLTAGQYRDIMNEALDKKIPKVEAVLARVEALVEDCAKNNIDHVNFIFTADETSYKVFEKVITELRALAFVCDRLETRGSNVWSIRW